MEEKHEEEFVKKQFENSFSEKKNHEKDYKKAHHESSHHEKIKEKEKSGTNVHVLKQEHHKKDKLLSKPLIVMVVLVALFILFNQYQINSLSGMMVAGLDSGSSKLSFSGEKDLSILNLDGIKTTGHTIAAVFPVGNIQTTEDAMAMLFPTGTPEYGEELGVSFDDPINSLATLANMYRPLKAEVQQNNPESWNKFMALALKPVGISCEFCCGLTTVGVDKNGDSACGCQHNPALLSVALYLSAYTDYNDGEILREVMRWKTLFFPKNMIELGMTVAGGDVSALDNLPGMVGGC